MSHVHLTQECEHGVRAGGCKCLGAEFGYLERTETVPCPPNCPHVIKAERDGNWSDLYMGERDVE